MQTFRRFTFVSVGTVLSALAAGAMSLSLTACDTAAGQGAGYGAAGGAIIGAAAGGSVRTAALGAGAGALIGASVDSGRGDRYSGNYRDYPVGSRTGRPGYVLSPYSPYYQIDCRGIPSGEPVRDPSCGRIFIVP